MHRLHRNSNGFTLIELTMVAAIIGLLASIAIPKFASLIDKAKEAHNKGVLGALRSSLSIYYADHDGTWYPTSLYTLEGKYINSVRNIYKTSRMQGNHALHWNDGVRFYYPDKSWVQFQTVSDTMRMFALTMPGGNTPAYFAYNPGRTASIELLCSHLDTKGVPVSNW